MRLSLKSESDTAVLAAVVQRNLAPGMCVALCGELGSGKTTFVRHVLHAFKSLDSVSSPTFVLEQRYDCPGGIRVEHWDLYRLSALPGELLEPVGGGSIRVIEWADKAPQIIKEAALVMYFEALHGAGLSSARSVLITGQLLLVERVSLALVASGLAPAPS